tara:strand:- start:781 stop:975 length:195 start_codon:yes stop_codon:yes gene_type:complete
MAILKKDASDGTTELKKEVEALKKEVAALKKQLAKAAKAPAGADPRVEVLWQALERMGKGKYLK